MDVLPVVTGTSGSNVTIFVSSEEGGSNLAVKTCHKPRVTVLRQVVNRSMIAPWLGPRLPAVIAVHGRAAEECLIMAAPSTTTLSAAVDKHGATPELVSLWRKACAELTGMWVDSAVPGFNPDTASRHHGDRVQRAKTALRKYGLPVDSTAFISGTDLSWRCLWQTLELLPLPPIRVACHGDPHPGNLLVATQDWYWVDWEWSGTAHDWRWMASHLTGWWVIRSILNAHDHEVSETAVARSCRPWVNAVLNAAATSLSIEQTNIQDRQTTSVLIGLLLLREIRQDTQPHLAEALLKHAAGFILTTARAEHPVVAEAFGDVVAT